MTLSSGTRLGPYEIQAAIGAGGMGEVYKARDTRLDRSVAIKVLPPQFSADPERRARFEREAKTIAGLNHSHICTLYDVGEHDGSTFLVMEHLTGETLGARLQKGALPLEQALSVATEIADALSAAHRQGVVHRDLKPGNVMLTKAGAKLLDFGLAKLKGHGEQPAAAHLASAPTQSTPLTGESMIVGTLPYMAPEQLEGKPADARTDLWALGAILYEMLTGKRAFTGDSAASLIGAILEREPPALATLQPLTPPALDHVVRTCLAKDPDLRWQSAADIARELAWITTQRTIVGAAASPRHRGMTLRTVAGLAVITVGACVLGFAGAGVLWGPRRHPATPALAVARVDIDAALAPSAVPFWGSLAVSPNGRLVAYVGQQEGRQRIFLRPLDARAASPVPGTEDAEFPFFSPDGRWLGFLTPDALKKVLLPSGPSEVIVPNLNAVGGAMWGPDDAIIFPADEQGSMVLLRVPATGGAPQRIMEANRQRGEWYLRNPTLLPDRRTLLVTASDGSCKGTRLLVQPLDGRPRRTLLEQAADARYLPTGHLVFVREAAVLIAPFDATGAKLLGPAVPLGELVGVEPCIAAGLSVSEAGVLAYLPSSSRPSSTAYSLVWVDRDGRELASSISRVDGAFGLRLSPEGRRVVLSLGRSPSITVVDLGRGVPTRVSTEGAGFWPIWLDGRRVAFALVQPGSGPTLFWRRADGTGPLQLIASSDLTPQPRAVTPDGKVLIFQQGVDPSTGFDVWTLALEQGAAPRPLLRERYHEYHPSLSPDGRWLAYVTEESGQPEVYVQPFPLMGDRLQVSAQGGRAPVWARDGRELFYQQGTSWSSSARLFAVRVDTASGFRAEMPRLLFRGPYIPPERYGQSYDVAVDGRFLMVKVEPPEPPAEIQLVLNWFEELKAKVPTGR